MRDVRAASVYTEQEDGTVCPWGTVLTWEPPQRFVLVWQANPEWQLEADLAKCSEVEVQFTQADNGTTLVELEHRGFERHGGSGAVWLAMNGVRFAERHSTFSCGGFYRGFGLCIGSGLLGNGCHLQSPVRCSYRMTG